MSEPRLFGGLISAARVGAGLTQREVAEAVGIDVTYLSKLENHRGSSPGAETIGRLADLLGLDRRTLRAIAGKLPDELRQRAMTDAGFAELLTRLPAAAPALVDNWLNQLRAGRP
jgi:transcriptional regulator with XRE-family HTH domain